MKIPKESLLKLGKKSFSIFEQEKPTAVEKSREPNQSDGKKLII